MHFLCHFGQICIKFGANLALKLCIQKIMQNHLFGTNLVSNRASKKEKLNAQLTPF